MLHQLTLIRVSIREESSICANVIFFPCSDGRYKNSQELHEEAGFSQSNIDLVSIVDTNESGLI